MSHTTLPIIHQISLVMYPKAVDIKVRDFIELSGYIIARTQEKEKKIERDQNLVITRS